LQRWDVAELLRGADIFVDLSSYQAFGCTGLEAMAVGCATVLPSGSGVEEYASNNENCLLVDTADPLAGVTAIDRLIRDLPLRRRIREAALATGRRYSVRRAAWSQLRLFGENLGMRSKSLVRVSVSDAD
jgi:glycosyltransferase involved in cell wall biosynthesis